MQLNVALEWFLNPDHLPIIVGIQNGYFGNNSVNIIVPDEHYDGFNALKSNEIEFAINEPLHLIEQFDENMLDLGTFFKTSGGVALTKEAEKKLLNKEIIRISSPVSNDVTNKVAFEILKSYAQKFDVEIKKENVQIEAVDFYHINNIKNGFDGAWLVFYNFEGVEAKLENVDIVIIDSALADVPNFAALDIFTTKTFYSNHKDKVDAFTNGIKESIFYIKNNKEEAKKAYYDFSKEEPSKLMDAIIDDTISRFDEQFDSNSQKQRELLAFFNGIGISSLCFDNFKGAFLK